MSIFDKPEQKQSINWDESTIWEIHKVLKNESISLSKDWIRKFLSKIPEIRIYRCENKCPFVLAFGGIKFMSCPICGEPLELLKTKIEKAPKELVELVLANGHFIHAGECIKKGENEKALAALTRAIELQPGFIDAYHNRSALKGMMGDKEGVISDCNCVLRLNPKDGGAYYNRGTAKAEGGDLDAAIDDFRKAIINDYSKPPVFLKLGLSLAKRGYIQEATPHLKKFIRLMPADPRVETVKKLLRNFNN